MKSAQSLPAAQDAKKKMRITKPKPKEVLYIKNDPEALKLTINPDAPVLVGQAEFEEYIREKRRRLGLD